MQEASCSSIKPAIIVYLFSIRYCTTYYLFMIYSLHIICLLFSSCSDSTMLAIIVLINLLSIIHYFII
jgi:hypothetical protein